MTRFLFRLNFTATDIDSPWSSLTAQIIAGAENGVPMSIYNCRIPFSLANCTGTYFSLSKQINETTWELLEKPLF
jgi:hypothetical protein